MKKLSFTEKITAFFTALFAKETPMSKKLLIIGAIIYGVSPIDLIPDILVGLGFSDDITIFIIAIYLFWKKLHPKQKQKVIDV